MAIALNFRFFIKSLSSVGLGVSSSFILLISFYVSVLAYNYYRNTSWHQYLGNRSDTIASLEQLTTTVSYILDNCSSCIEVIARFLLPTLPCWQ